MIDPKELLKQAREANADPGIEKKAFNAMTPEAMAAAQQQGAAPPMDPAMGGGAPPMDPAMMGAPPMDPAMGGGAPPMDPAMMDPAMMGAPPMDPAMMDPAMTAPPGGEMPMEDPAAAMGTPVTLTLEDLQQVMTEMKAAEEGGEGEPKRATNKQIMKEITGLKDSIAALAAASGVQLPAGDVGTDGDVSATAATANPEDIAAVADEMAAMGGGGDMGMDPMSQAMDMGLPPGEMPPDAMPKMALDKWGATKVAANS